MPGERLSVVVPMYRTSRHLPELLARLDAAVPHAEVVLVDDACPERSADGAAAIDAGTLRVVIVRLSTNLGQHAAVHVGLATATRELVAVMDADLQDEPEALPVLLDALAAQPALGAVCSSRAGTYTTAGRQRSARTYRWMARVLSGGRIPQGAGMYLVAQRSAVQAVRDLDDPYAPLVTALAAAHVPLDAIAVERRGRDDGRSAHGGRDRLRIAVRGLVVLTPLRSWQAARHRRHLAARALVVQVDTPQQPGAHHG